MTRKIDRNRPRSGLNLQPEFRLRAAEKQFAAWRAAAQRAGQNLSEWLRRAADERARKT